MNPNQISDVAHRLKAIRERAGLTLREVAEALGWSLTRYQHYEDRYKRPYLPLELAHALAPILGGRKGIDPQEILLLAGIGSLPPIESGTNFPTAPRAVARRLMDRTTAPGIVTGRDLPVIGSVKGGAGGFYFNDGEAKEYVVRPAALVGVANGFALYVNGDSMEPRYFAGEILYVNPNRPLTKNCFVAVELENGEGLIKQFVRRSDDEIVLRQFNPDKQISLPITEVKRIYRIIAAGEAA